MREKRKIAVVCANLPDRNTGMVTVDLAAHVLLQSCFPDDDVTLYCFDRGHHIPYTSGEIAHRYLNIVNHSAEFLASDIFIYWGDFLHSHSYWEYDMKNYNSEMQKLSPEQREKAVSEQERNRSKLIFLSEKSVEDLKNVVVFGSTIITNEAGDTHDSGYQNDFDRFFAEIGNVFFRDALSAAKISPFRLTEPTLGCDCAFLLDNEDLKKLSGFKLASQRDGVGVFFGRSPSKLTMLIFAKLVSSALGEKTKWLPWFMSGRKMQLAGKLFGYNVPAEAISPGEILTIMSGCKFIVTDTYHICVNAWRMGIPAVCIGLGGSGAVHSLADKKKEILFEMYGARQFYVFLEGIRSLRGIRAEAVRVASVLRDTVLAARVVQNIQAHRIMAFSRLKSALGRLCV